MAKLVISRNDNMLGSRFIEDARLTIGRASGNLIQLDDPSVSKMHAQVEVVGHDHILLDLGSSNGTYVNGERISRHLLQHGDIVEVSEFQIRYVDHRTVVNGEGDRTMVIERTHASQSPPGLVTSAPVPAARAANVNYANGMLRVIQGGANGSEVTLARPLHTVGKGAERAAILRRLDGFYVARVEGAPPRVNGKQIADGWQPLANRDFIETGGEAVQIWIDKTTER
jgi:hypothetical protein